MISVFGRPCRCARGRGADPWVPCFGGLAYNSGFGEPALSSNCPCAAHRRGRSGLGGRSRSTWGLRIVYCQPWRLTGWRSQVPNTTPALVCFVISGPFWGRLRGSHWSSAPIRVPVVCEIDVWVVSALSRRSFSHSRPSAWGPAPFGHAPLREGKPLSSARAALMPGCGILARGLSAVDWRLFYIFWPGRPGELRMSLRDQWVCMRFPLMPLLKFGAGGIADSRCGFG